MAKIQKPRARPIVGPDGTAFLFTRKQDLARDTLISDATHCALGGGSRSGKTFLLVRQVLVRAIKEPNSRHVIFRFRFNALWASVVLDTLPKVLRLCFPQLPPVSDMLNSKMGFLTLPNGAEIWFGGLDDKERTEKILGMEFATIYFNECSQIPYASILLALTRLAQQTKTLALKAFYDFNPPSKMHWTFLMFVEKKDPQNKRPFDNEFNYTFYLLNPADNKQNIAKGYMEILEALPAKARDRFLLGKFADDSEGSLWSVETLDQNRVLGQEGQLPDWLRVVVAVDPSGCSGPEDTRSDEIGIIVAAVGIDGHGYLLADLSGRYKPEQWGKVACDAYEHFRADKIVGESNFGGDMVRAVVQAQNPNVPFGLVTATRGKVVRATPISSLYDQARIHHIGYFQELEDQMCAFMASGYIGLKSPDRADALVWAFTELFPGMTKPLDKRDAAPPPKITRDRSASRYSPSHRRRI